MPPRNRKHDEERDAFLVNIVKIARKGGDVVKEILRFRNEHGTNHDERTMAAREFSLEEAVAAFGLQFSMSVSFSKPQVRKV